MELILCQVKQRKDEWPYVEACKEPATHHIELAYRSQPGVDGIEYICAKHAKEMIDGFGENSVAQLQYQFDVDTLRVEPFSSAKSS